MRIVRSSHPRGKLPYERVLEHDCGKLGNTSGCCVMDLETHEVLGLQVSGRSMATGTALALWHMRDCPKLRDAGVGFAVTDVAEIDWTKNAIEKIAQTSHWTKFSVYVRDAYQREFGEAKVC